jgi:hypothetical protein
LVSSLLYHVAVVSILVRFGFLELPDLDRSDRCSTQA